MTIYLAESTEILSKPSDSLPNLLEIFGNTDNPNAMIKLSIILNNLKAAEKIPTAEEPSTFSKIITPTLQCRLTTMLIIANVIVLLKILLQT
jgi:hypothetical protein